MNWLVNQRVPVSPHMLTPSPKPFCSCLRALLTPLGFCLFSLHLIRPKCSLIVQSTMLCTCKPNTLGLLYPSVWQGPYKLVFKDVWLNKDTHINYPEVHQSRTPFFNKGIYSSLRLFSVTVEEMYWMQSTLWGNEASYPSGKHQLLRSATEHRGWNDHHGGSRRKATSSKLQAQLWAHRQLWASVSSPRGQIRHLLRSCRSCHHYWLNKKKKLNSGKTDSFILGWAFESGYKEC